MTSPNGRIPDADLTTVAVGVQLTTPTGNAYRALVAQAAHEHVAIKPAPGVGSGYRDLAVQALYYDAWKGDKVARDKVHYNTSSTAPVAAPGGSSHGWGNRIDLLFDGSQEPTVVDLNLAKRFGFTREFGAADANHFEHDGKTAIHPSAPAPAGAVTYTVKRGDTLSQIAEDHGLTLAQIEAANPGLADPDLIHVGQKINLTAAHGSVTVGHGDTLSGIAGKHGLTLTQIEHLNPQVKDPDLIHPGDKIRIR